MPLLLFTSLYFLLRLPNLTLQPIFADEAIYIRWAQVMRAEPSLRFLPLTDGKTPLFMWVMMPMFEFIQDPLFAGRVLSILSGFFTLLGVFFLSKKVFNARTAFWASLLYTATPYTVFFDRMALVDSMLSAFTIWILYFAIKLAGSPKFGISVILGFVLGGAWLTKTPAYINIFLLPISILGFQVKIKYDLLKLLFYWAIAVLIALFMYNLLRLSPSFHLLSGRNADYMFSLTELSGRPLDPFIPHMKDLADWFPKFLTWPILGVMGWGSWVMIRARNRLGWVVLLWAVIPILLLSAFLKTFTTRYILFSIPILLVFAGYGIEKISSFKFLTSNRILVLGVFLTVIGQ
ncbi:glycosyltransferase family 39 protein, partial [Candidatus Daviesbacteria bacterium]|nr:glycosyltransferase family 39 protein [Candidatus Daviesbacteria bacterium]